MNGLAMGSLRLVDETEWARVAFAFLLGLFHHFAQLGSREHLL